jgi:hypothetical protein
VCYPALPCKLAAVVIHRMLWCKEGVLSCAVMHASCCHDSQNALVEGVLSCAAMQARCCCDSQNALVKVCYPALPCKLAAVVIHRMLWWKKVCYPRAAKLAAVVIIHRMLWCKEGCYPLPCMLAAVMIHRMLWWKKGVLSLRCHASSLL